MDIIRDKWVNELKKSKKRIKLIMVLVDIQ